MRVAIVAPNLAMYRRALYQVLDSYPGADFVHFADPREMSGIRPMDSAGLVEFNVLRNLVIGPLLWQKGAISAGFRKDIDSYIFTGNVKYASTWAAALIARARRKSVHFWTMGWHKKECGLKRIIRLVFYRIAHGLLVYSDMGKDLAIASGYPAERIHVVLNSVADLPEDGGLFTPRAGETVAVGAAARLTEAKNFTLLVQALALLRERGSAIRLILLGDGPERERLVSLVDQSGIDCEFLGAKYEPSEIRDFYRSIWVTVLPSAAGLTTIQSLAHGVPVITDDAEDSQGPESCAILPGVTGDRYAAGEVEALASKLLTWVGKVDEAPDRVATVCRREVENRWTPESQARRMIHAVTR